MSAPDRTWEIERTDGPTLFVREWLAVDDEAYVLVLIHGTAGHGGCYDEFAAEMTRHGARVLSPDLRGHGRSGGPRGRFTMTGLLDDVAAVVERAVQTGVPVVLLGASQGGELAFHALQRCPDVAGSVCMNILLARELPLNRRMKLMQSAWVGRVARVIGDRLAIPLRRVIDFRAAYREDPELYRAKRRDPLYVWRYGLQSYRSVFTYRPPLPPSANTKPVLVACGEDDPIVGADHCRAAAARIGGPVSVFVQPRAGHQLMQFYRTRFATVVDDWVRFAVLDARRTPWSAPSDDDDVYERFVDEQRELATHDEYALSRFDRALCRIANGSIDHGVEFFRTAKYGEHGRFVGQVVARIDAAAWSSFAPFLPERPGCVAVLGCGIGDGIAALRAAEPRLAAWRIVGIDVDGEAIAEARRRFADVPSIAWRTADARTLGDDEPGRFDAIYAHGIFDHCSDHRGVLAAAAVALRPGGVLLYVTPDRNVSTWMRFVAIGPRFVFGLDWFADLHDYRRFPRPAELDALARDVGLVPEPDPEGPARVFHRGIDYAAGPFAIRSAVRRRDLSRLGFRVTRPRWWLGGGYTGEYIGVLRRNAT